MSNIVPAPSSALAKPPEPVAAMKQWITKSSGAFAKILPKHVTAERFIKVAHAAITKSPKLAQAEPRDVIMALIQCSEMGLEPNTPLHHVHLIPFKNYRASQRAGRDVFDVQVIVGFEGYLELIYRSGRVKSISCEAVYESDEFDYELGSSPFVHHKLNLRIRDARDRGEVVAAYLCADIEGGGRKVVVMPYAEIAAIRDASQGYQYALKDRKDHPWISSFGEMAKKTVLRRAQKQLPKSVESGLARAAEIDTRSEVGARKSIDVDLAVLAELPVDLGITSTDAMRADDDDRGEPPPADEPAQVEPPKANAQAEKMKARTRAAKAPAAPAPTPPPAPEPTREPVAEADAPPEQYEPGADG